MFVPPPPLPPAEYSREEQERAYRAVLKLWPAMLLMSRRDNGAGYGDLIAHFVAGNLEKYDAVSIVRYNIGGA